MPEMLLCQPRFICSPCALLTKNKGRIQKLKDNRIFEIY